MAVEPIIWKSSILPKHRFALWIFAHGKFLTRDRLGDIPNKNCVLCNEKPETVQHLFYECTVTKQLLKSIRLWVGMEKNMGSATTILKAYRTTYRGNSTLAKMRYAALAACIYHV